MVTQLKAAALFTGSALLIAEIIKKKWNKGQIDTVESERIMPILIFRSGGSCDF